MADPRADPRVESSSSETFLEVWERGKVTRRKVRGVGGGRVRQSFTVLVGEILLHILLYELAPV